MRKFSLSLGCMVRKNDGVWVPVQDAEKLEKRFQVLAKQYDETDLELKRVNDFLAEQGMLEDLDDWMIENGYKEAENV